ncbi:hypothetical protein ABK01_01705 [Treponema sp. OMZ 305]|uniref:hypothetical protein n=1 Tax=Treponema sp. OMZ 305 TaxID=1659192 RepID=UPI0020A52888|nr:hypothetical protein [Treponema sp. OMZ 305]UTC57103.1 hypothetical protein ABK01_01705 [Treponema sp. OMZ 305]
MFIASLIFFYTFPASLIFLHGIGLERLSMNARSTRVIISFILRDGAIMLIAASLSWLLEFSLLLPLDIVSITPVVALIIVYLCDLVLYRILLKRTESRLIRERLFSGGTVIFALYQAFTYIELIAIVLSALASMLVWSFILCAVKRRVEESNVSAQWKNAPLLLISMGLIALALYAWDIAWLTPALL